MALVIAAFIASLLLVYVFVQIKYRNFFKALDKFPGPPALPILGNTWQLYKFDFDQIKILTHFREHYGRTLRAYFGPRAFVFLSKPEDVEVVLSNMKNITKGQPYNYLVPWLGEGLLVSTGSKWHARRKMLTPTFHFRILEEFLEVFDRNGNILVDQLKKKAETKEVFDIFGPISLCALDIICETAMGSQVHAQLDSQSHYVASVKAACRGLYIRTLQVWLHFESTFRASTVGKEFFKALDILHGKTNEVVASRSMEREKKERKISLQEDDFGMKKRKAFLDQLLDSKDNGADLTMQDIKEEVNTFMFEGHDTTTASMAFTLYSLATLPEIQEKAFEEQKEIFGDDINRPTTSQDLNDMKYLERVIKESLRLYPSVPVYMRSVTSDIELPDGKVIPTGCTIGISAHCMGSNEEVWPNPEVFDPDRFLPEAMAGRHPYAYVPFSAGPRNCIGQKFAMLEMKSTISKLIRNFRLSPGRSSSEEIQVVAEVILKAKNGLLIRVEKRV